jgi:hypothetical protein
LGFTSSFVPISLVLLFQREDLFRLILFLPLPKPPMPMKLRTKMMPKFHWKKIV